MAQQVINVGTVANDGTGDPLRTAFIKVNANFAELYTLIPQDTGGNPIPVAPINSPAFTGDPHVPTPPYPDADLSAANTAWVSGNFAPINNPTFTGDPKVPTPLDPDNDTSVANTAWVRKNFVPIPLPPLPPPPAGVDLTAYAPLASPIFTGDPRSNATLLPNDNDTSLATTAWVTALVSGTGGGSGGGSGSTTLLFGGGPQGRLTLQSGTPVMTSSTTGTTTIYYTPYVGNRIPIWDGTGMAMATFTEINAVTPTAPIITANKVNDWFVWLDKTIPASPVVKLVHGPDWTDAVNRAPSGLLQRLQGILVNSAPITNGPAASMGTYVGTTYSDANSLLNFKLGTKALGGGAAVLTVWNCYNRINVWTQVSDTTASWTIPADITYRPLNNSLLNRISFVSGLPEDALFSAHYVPIGTASGGIIIGMGFDIITNVSGPSGWTQMQYMQIGTSNIYPAATGFHFIQAMQWGGSAILAYGDGAILTGATLNQALQFMFKM